MTERTPGALMAAEIGEQPDRWRDLIGGGERTGIDAAAAAIRARRPRFVLLFARGTSDRAALYAKYLAEIRLQLPAGLASPSTTTVYAARPDLRDVLVVGISQSGGSPDLVRGLGAARGLGALTVAVTNSPGSELAAEAEFGVDVLAGPERAVAATKSYTAELLALYLLLEQVRTGRPVRPAGLPELGEQVLELEPAVAAAATRYRFVERLVVAARGYSLASAQEAALKLTETCYLLAQAYSGADLLHGPLAALDDRAAVLLLAGPGRGGDALREIVPRIAATGADRFGIGTAGTVRLAGAGLELPATAEELTPLLEILPAQQLALHLARARGIDPDVPRGLRKVTRTV